MTISNLIKTFFSLILCLSIGLSATQAQIVKEAGDRTKRKAKNRLDRKIDNTVDDGFNAIEGLFKKKKKKKAIETEETSSEEEVYVDDEGTIHSDGVEISFEENDPGDATPNAWEGRFTMEMIEYKNGKEKERTKTEMHLDTYKTAIVSETDGEEPAVVIFDKANGTMITKSESDGEKTAMVIKVPKVNVNTDEVYNDVYEENNLPRATGEFKTIQNRRCQKYEYEDEEVTSYAWITEDGDFNMMNVFGAMNVNPSGRAANPPRGSAFSFQGGMVMEAVTIEKGKDRRNEMYMRDIQKNGQDKRLFDLSEYNVMKVPNVGGFLQNKN